MTVKIRNALTGIWNLLKREDGFAEVSLPSKNTDKSPEGDGKGDTGDPETLKDKDTTDVVDDEGEETSKAKLDKAVEESKKRKERYQKAEKERDESNTKLAKLEKDMADIKKKFDPKAEPDGDDKDAKIKELEAKAEKEKKELIIQNEFRIHALAEGMSNDTLGLVVKNLNYGDTIEYDPQTGYVEGMSDFVLELKAKLPNLFQSTKPQDAGEGGNPKKTGDKEIKPEIEVLAQRQNWTIDFARKIHEKRSKDAEKAGKPATFEALWGIRKDHTGKIV